MMKIWAGKTLSLAPSIAVTSALSLSTTHYKKSSRSISTRVHAASLVEMRMPGVQTLYSLLSV